ncbi:hypothetical protein BB559_005404, partial [Furculomyces boomerangus]
TSVRRKKAKQEVSTYLTKEHSKDKDMPMLLLGDFNADIAQSDRLTRRIGISLRRVSISNSTGSRRHNGKMGRMVDHIYYRGFHEHPDAGRVNKYLDLSDHFPMTTKWTFIVAEQFKSHNRFAVLADKKDNGKVLVENLVRATLGVASTLETMSKPPPKTDITLSRDTLVSTQRQRLLHKQVSRVP